MRAPRTSRRGFAYFDAMTDLDHQSVHVAESSLATTPAVRIYVGLRCAHLSVEQAELVIEQLRYLVDHHHQA